MSQSPAGALEMRGGNGNDPASRAEDTPSRGAAALPGWVVAIGVSFDGVHAVAAVLRGLPEPFPGAVLVALHRGPTGQLPLVLSRLAGRTVTEPAEGEVLQPGGVYVAPGDRHLVVRDGHIGVEQSERVRFSRPSIDVLLSSVANVYGPQAIGVLLSGYGSDGVMGLQAIRAGGGTTIVQDPTEARAPQLPRAAVAADGIDMMLPLAEIGPAIARLVSTPSPRPSAVAEDTAAE